MLWEKEVKGAGTFHVDSVRLTNGAHPTNTANASMVLNIVRDNDMPVFSIHCMGAYGKILLNRYAIYIRLFPHCFDVQVYIPLISRGYGY